jgi:hypothetical protein
MLFDIFELIIFSLLFYLIFKRKNKEKFISNMDYIKFKKQINIALAKYYEYIYNLSEKTKNGSIFNSFKNKIKNKKIKILWSKQGSKKTYVNLYEKIEEVDFKKNQKEDKSGFMRVWNKKCNKPFNFQRCGNLP